MEILSTEHQKELVNQARLKRLYTNEYLYDDKNENLKLIADLFFDNDIKRAKQFNVGSNIFATITDTISNFVGKPQSEIQVNVSEQTKDLVSVGKGIFGIRRVNGELQVYHIQAKDHTIIEGVDTVFKMYEVADNYKKDFYVLKQSFYPTYIENKLYKVAQATSTTGSIVALDTIPQTAGLQEVIETGMQSIYVMYKESLLEKIKHLVYSMDRKLVMFETQFLGEIEQFKIFQNIAIPEDALNENGRVDFKKLGKIFANDMSRDGQSDIKIISNQNQLISEAIDYEEKQIRKVSSTTSIPTDFLGISDGGAVSGTSRELLMQAFIKTIENYRAVIENTLRDIFEVMQGDINLDDSIIWREVLTKSDKQLAEELKIAREAGVISQFTGVKLYLDLDDEQAQLEVDRMTPVGEV